VANARSVWRPPNPGQRPSSYDSPVSGLGCVWGEPPMPPAPRGLRVGPPPAPSGSATRSPAAQRTLSPSFADNSPIVRRSEAPRDLPLESENKLCFLLPPSVPIIPQYPPVSHGSHVALKKARQTSLLALRQTSLLGKNY